MAEGLGTQFWHHAAGATAMRVLLAAAGLDAYLESRIEVLARRTPCILDAGLLLLVPQNQSPHGALAASGKGGLWANVLQTAINAGMWCCCASDGRSQRSTGVFSLSCLHMRAQVGTPVTAAIRYREGAQLAGLGLSPYAGAAFHGPPLLLAGAQLLDSLIGRVVPGFSVLAAPWRVLVTSAADIAAAAALAGLAAAAAQPSSRTGVPLLLGIQDSSEGQKVRRSQGLLVATRVPAGCAAIIRAQGSREAAFIVRPRESVWCIGAIQRLASKKC